MRRRGLTCSFAGASFSDQNDRLVFPAQPNNVIVIFPYRERSTAGEIGGVSVDRHEPQEILGQSQVSPQKCCMSEPVDVSALTVEEEGKLASALKLADDEGLEEAADALTALLETAYGRLRIARAGFISHSLHPCSCSWPQDWCSRRVFPRLCSCARRLRPDSPPAGAGAIVQEFLPLSFSCFPIWL